MKLMNSFPFIVFHFEPDEKIAIEKCIEELEKSGMRFTQEGIQEVIDFYQTLLSGFDAEDYLLREKQNAEKSVQAEAESAGDTGHTRERVAQGGVLQSDEEDGGA